MKKSLMALAMTAFLVSSCKKDRVCNCTVPANGSVPEQKWTYTMKDSKKRSAKNSCQIAHDHWALSGGKCELAK